MLQTESHDRHKGKFLSMLNFIILYLDVRFQGINVGVLLSSVTSELLKCAASRPRDLFICV